MSFQIRSTQFDVALMTGSRVSCFPSIGIRTISKLCADFGLKVAWLGGDDLQARGVIPGAQSGAVVLAQDAQERIHRLEVRSVVRLSLPQAFPEPFEGWRSQGLVPFETAVALDLSKQMDWNPSVVILGSGNRALRWASHLLESGVREVYCLESLEGNASKPYTGWEVEFRRFQMLGGRFVRARLLSLQQKSALLWELRVRDEKGVRVLETTRVISIGPFSSRPGVREYPQGSLLFEMDQTALATKSDDVEGWVNEEVRSRWIAAKLIRSLVQLSALQREELERIHRRSKRQMRQIDLHKTETFQPVFQGKWMDRDSSQRLRSFSGVPTQTLRPKGVASIECLESIECNLCEKACPEGAISLASGRKGKESILKQDLCTSCGLCLVACPSRTPVLIEERESSQALLVLSAPAHHDWVEKQWVTLLNRRGDSLGTARLVRVLEEPSTSTAKLLEIEVPSHLIWEARSVRKPRTGAAVDETFLKALHRHEREENKVEILLDGVKRFARDQIPLSQALLEMGHARADDVLNCSDASCGRCVGIVDGQKKFLCSEKVHRGMAVRLDARANSQLQFEVSSPDQVEICPCLGMSRGQLKSLIHQGKLNSPEAICALTQVGGGVCHGQLCFDSVRKIMADEGVDSENFVDWRFPARDWSLNPSG